MRLTIRIALVAALSFSIALPACSAASPESDEAERSAGVLYDRAPHAEQTLRTAEVVVQAWNDFSADDAEDAVARLSDAGFAVTPVEDVGYAGLMTRTLVVAQDEGALSSAEDVAELLGIPRSSVVLDSGGYDFDGEVLVMVGVR